MRNRTFSPDIKIVYDKDPNRKFTLEEIERSLDRLTQKYCPSWQGEIDVSIFELTQEIGRIETASGDERAKLIFEWTNASIRTGVTLSSLKAVDLTDSLIQAANDKRFTICALATRSLLELASILCYLHKGLTPYLSIRFSSAAEFEEIRKLVRKAIFGGHYDFEKVLFNDPRKTLAGRNWKRPKHERLPRFSELMRPLDEFALQVGLARVRGSVEMRYSALSDFVHPTAASLLLYGSGKPGVFRLRHNDTEMLGNLLDQTVLPASHYLLMTEKLINALAQVKFFGLKP